MIKLVVQIMKLTLSTSTFRHIQSHKLDQLFPDLSRAGFQRLELKDNGDFDDSTLIKLRQQAHDQAIEIPNWHLIQITPFQETLHKSREAIDRVKESIRQGNIIGAKNHVLHWDHRFNDSHVDALWPEIVREWVDCAVQHDARILMETVPYNRIYPRYVFCYEIYDFVCGYPPEVMAICLDVNHSNINESLPDVVSLLSNRLISLHISDNDGISERHWLPGQGVIDYRSLFQSLDRNYFDGFAVLEVNRWCEEPESYQQLKKLHDYYSTLLTKHQPHPETPSALRSDAQ